MADPLKKLVLKRIHATDQFVLESCKNEVYFMQRLVGLDNIVEFENAAINTLPNNNGYEVLILMEYCAGEWMGRWEGGK